MRDSLLLNNSKYTPEHLVGAIMPWALRTFDTDTFKIYMYLVYESTLSEDCISKKLSFEEIAYFTNTPITIVEKCVSKLIRKHYISKVRQGVKKYGYITSTHWEDFPQYILTKY